MVLCRLYTRTILYNIQKYTNREFGYFPKINLSKVYGRLTISLEELRNIICNYSKTGYSVFRKLRLASTMDDDTLNTDET